MNMIPRPEYPRPDFMRNEWQILNGQWEFSFDEPTYDKEITVPFCYQAKASGIGVEDYHEVVWYRRKFTIDGDKLEGKNLLLHFGAVDYAAAVWVNGVYVGEHEGGHVGFSFNVTHAVKAGENEVVVKAADAVDADKPRGKQSWTGERFGCWYTPTSGIWQSVWLEYAGSTYLKRVKITPNIDELNALCEVFLSDNTPVRVRLTCYLEKEGVEEELVEVAFTCKNGYGKAMFAFEDLDMRRENLFWSPEQPNLIYVKAAVENTTGAFDEVQTYFGMRNIGTHNKTLSLNNEFYYQRLVLDQGYWKDSLLTPPSDAAIIEDIKLTKAMGFNGARKHQKIEDPRYYYWADKLGLLVWGEMPSCYMFNDRAIKRTTNEMIEFVERDYNHPSIVAWVPVNESWGVRNIQVNKQQQDYTTALVYMLRGLDPVRFISGNDGWEQQNETDICGIHDYALFQNNLDKYEKLDRILETGVQTRYLFAEKHKYNGQPIVMTEYGGISFTKDTKNGWGYFKTVDTEEDFLNRLGPVTSFLIKGGVFCGFCYTQLTDVMQEVNGLLDEERNPKVDIEKLHAIFSQPIEE